MLKKNISILIGVAVVIIATAAYFMFIKKNEKSTSWRTDPAKVDIVVSENRHTNETLPPVNTTAVAADSVAVEQPDVKPTFFQPIEINIQASSISELADKIKGETEVILSNNPYLSPSGIKLDLQKNSFYCMINQASQKSNFVKLGLYYGPAASGCESCRAVIQKNPGSVVLASGNGNGLAGQVIGIKL
jgi:hypothetical protein